MIHTKRAALVPALALTFAGLGAGAAQAGTDPQATDVVTALAVASCQLDAASPLTAEQMAPVVQGQADVEVVPGEITVHVYRAEVQTSAGDARQCTFGVLHRDAQLKQVQHLGSASLALVDTVGGTSYAADIDFAFGNMGKSSPVDARTEVGLGGFLTPLENATADPTYTVSLQRKSLQVVEIAVHRSVVKAAAKQEKRKVKAAAQLLKKQTKAAHGKHAEKKLAAAQRAYDRKVAKAQAQFDRLTAPKTVTRPVSQAYTVSGSVPVAG